MVQKSIYIISFITFFLVGCYVNNQHQEKTPECQKALASLTSQSLEGHLNQVNNICNPK